MKESQRIAKNIGVMLVAEAIGFTLNFALTVIIARYLGVDRFGQYSFMMAFVLVFQLLADSGLSNIMIREIASNREHLPYQLGVTKSLIWLFSIVAFALIALAVNIVNPEKAVKVSIYIMGLAVLATVHAIGYSSVFRALEEMEYNAIGFVLHKILLLGLVVLVVKLKMGLPEIAGAYLVSNLFLWLLYYVITSLRYQRPKFIVDPKAWWYFISEAIPIGIASLTRRITWQIDILILSAIATSRSVGLFSAPYKIIQSMNMLPQTVALPLYPLYSRLAKDSILQLYSTYERSLRLMLLMSVPFVLILATFSRTIVLLLLGKTFEESHAALQILSLTLLFLFPTSQFVYFFSSIGKQKFYTIASLLGLGVNILLDLVLIPRLDFLGACIGTLVAEILLFATGIFYTKTVAEGVSFTRALWKPFAAGSVMLAVLLPFRDSHPYWIALGAVLGVFVYIFSVLLLKAFSKAELATLRESVRFLG